MMKRTSMKYTSTVPFWALLVPVLLLAGCFHTRSSADEAAPADETEERVRGSELRGEDIAKSRENSIEEVLRGRVSGVTVMRGPGGGFQLRIRGTSTFGGSNEPLIVIDGVPLPHRYSGSIPVSPYDVDSIRVLKNATDTAFYGVRGANGVIIITTKRGS